MKHEEGGLGKRHIVALLHELIDQTQELNHLATTMCNYQILICLYSLGTIKASQAVVLNEDSVVVTQRKLM